MVKFVFKVKPLEVAKDFESIEDVENLFKNDSPDQVQRVIKKLKDKGGK